MKRIRTYLPVLWNGCSTRILSCRRWCLKYGTSQQARNGRTDDRGSDRQSRLLAVFLAALTIFVAAADSPALPRARRLESYFVVWLRAVGFFVCRLVAKPVVSDQYAEPPRDGCPYMVRTSSPTRRFVCRKQRSDSGVVKRASHCRSRCAGVLPVLAAGIAAALLARALLYAGGSTGQWRSGPAPPVALFSALRTDWLSLAWQLQRICHCCLCNGVDSEGVNMVSRGSAANSG